MMRVSVAINLVLTVTVFNDYLKNLAQAQAQWDYDYYPGVDSRRQPKYLSPAPNLGNFQSRQQNKQQQQPQQLFPLFGAASHENHFQPNYPSRSSSQFYTGSGNSWVSSPSSASPNAVQTPIESHPLPPQPSSDSSIYGGSNLNSMLPFPPASMVDPYAMASSKRQFPASYRSELGQDQREKLSRIGSENENFVESGSRTNNGQTDGFQRMLSTIASKLPRLAELTMAQLTAASGNKAAGNKPAVAAEGVETALASKTIEQREFVPGFSGRNFLGQSEKNSGSADPTLTSPTNSAGAVVDSMPQPKSIFSFDKIVSAFGKMSGLPEEKLAEYDKMLRGTPILKPFDKSEQTENGKPSSPIESKSVSALNDFLRQFGLAKEKESSSTPPNSVSSDGAAKTDQQHSTNGHPDDDIFGSLIKGKMPNIDWFRALGLRGNGGSASTTGGENAGNALAQLFGGSNGSGGMFSSVGSVFGSGLDDSPKQ